MEDVPGDKVAIEDERADEEVIEDEPEDADDVLSGSSTVSSSGRSSKRSVVHSKRDS